MGFYEENMLAAAQAIVNGTAVGGGGTNDTASFDKPAGTTQTGSIIANGGTALATFDALNFQTISLQVSGTFVATLQLEVSNNGVDWASKYLVSGSGIVTQTTTAGVFAGDIGARYFRVRASAFTSGTATITALYGAYSTNQMGNLSIGYINPGQSGAALGKSEDAAAGTGDTGIFFLGVRNDNAAATPTSATGDYSQLSVGPAGELFTRAKPANTAGVTTPTLTAATSGVVLAANAGRRGATIQNKTGAVLLLKCGTAASATSRSIELADGATWEVPSNYAGIIHGFATLAPAGNTILVTEFTD